MTLAKGGETRVWFFFKAANFYPKNQLRFQEDGPESGATKTTSASSTAEGMKWKEFGKVGWEDDENLDNHDPVCIGCWNEN